VRQPSPAVPPAALSRALDTVATERDGSLSQPRRWRTATVLAAAAAIIVGVLLGAKVIRNGTPSTPNGVPFVASDGVSASGSAFLLANPWGTAVTLQLNGLPQGEGFTAWATAADGTRSIAATWAPTPDGHASLTGEANIPQTQLASLQVMQGQTALLTLARPR